MTWSRLSANVIFARIFAISAGPCCFYFRGKSIQAVLPMDTSTSSVPTTTSPAASSATIIPGMAAAPAERAIAATPPTTAAPIRTPRNTFAPVPAEVRLFPETLSTD
jgi:xanthine dehydrogenase molybdopterin-binding subunit B